MIEFSMGLATPSWPQAASDCSFLPVRTINHNKLWCVAFIAMLVCYILGTIMPDGFFSGIFLYYIWLPAQIHRVFHFTGNVHVDDPMLMLLSYVLTFIGAVVQSALLFYLLGWLFMHRKKN